MAVIPGGNATRCQALALPQAAARCAPGIEQWKRSSRIGMRLCSRACAHMRGWAAMWLRSTAASIAIPPPIGRKPPSRSSG